MNSIKPSQVFSLIARYNKGLRRRYIKPAARIEIRIKLWMQINLN